MQKKIKIIIETMSNLLIGGAPPPFEIGGVDQYTATTYDGYPYIPASSLKGAWRGIVRDDNGDHAQAIAGLYRNYLAKEKKVHWEEIEQKYNEKEALERIKKRYEQEAKAEFLFGMEGFNNSPKLLINDLYLCEESKDLSKCFSIDAKTSIEKDGNTIVSNPRTYKAARKGLKFEGEILLYNIDLLGDNAIVEVTDYIKETLSKFNNGVYRLGNSKSRGYGRIKVYFENDSEVS